MSCCSDVLVCPRYHVPLQQLLIGYEYICCCGVFCLLGSYGGYPASSASKPNPADTGSPGSLITGDVTDVTLPSWDTPTTKRRPLITPGGIGRLSGGAGGSGSGGGGGGGGGGGPAADTPDVSPLWGGKHDGASPALSAITAAEFSPYRVESATLHTPGGGRRGRRAFEETREEYMDISSAARDLRELSQITVDEKVGAGGGRVPSSSDVGRARSGGLKAGRNKGECVVVLKNTGNTRMSRVLRIAACFEEAALVGRRSWFAVSTDQRQQVLRIIMVRGCHVLTFVNVLRA